MVKAKQIPKSFGNKNIFENLTFNIERGKVLGIFGCSGCGKTTLLRTIGGFEKLDSGEIYIDGQTVTKPMRSTILIFQTFEQLLPWKTVLENISFPLITTKIAASKKSATNAALQYLLEMGLEDKKDEYPHKLSGGMKQRVALARALSLKPKVVLMDEPFASLDSITRKKMGILTKEISAKYDITVIFVSHNVKEILFLSDKILVFYNNRNIKYMENDKVAENILLDFESEIIKDEIDNNDTNRRIVMI